MRVLVVDDDEEVRDLLVRALQQDGHLVTHAGTGAAARRILDVREHDLVVLDLALPDATGIEVCAALRREHNDVPILLLTAHTDVARRVEGLDAGADDFLGKPFALAELRARLRALGRRRRTAPALPRLERDGVTLDFGARSASQRGRPVTLTAREWTILDALAARRGRVVPRTELLEEVWGEATEQAGASLEVLVARIRKKLGAPLIRTVRGEGYALEAG